MNFLPLGRIFRKQWIFGFFLLSLFGAGCLRTPVNVSKVSEPSASTVKAWKTVEWTSVGDGVERMDFAYATTTPVRMVLYRFPPNGFDWRFAYATETRRVSDWADAYPNVRLVANSVYFHPDQYPSGLLVARGKRIGIRQFDFDRTGVIVFSAHGLRIIDTKQEPFDQPSAVDAAQSYPFLIRDGIPVVSEDSGKYARRTFVGTDEEGRSYVGIVPDEPVTLRELAQMLTRVFVAWDRVINLDGGPSSGLSYRTASFDELMDSYTAVPGVLLVLKSDRSP